MFYIESLYMYRQHGVDDNLISIPEEIQPSFSVIRAMKDAVLTPISQPTKNNS